MTNGIDTEREVVRSPTIPFVKRMANYMDQESLVIEVSHEMLWGVHLSPEVVPRKNRIRKGSREDP